MGECFLETLDDVFACLSVFEAVLCPPSDDFAPVVQEYREKLIYAEDFGVLVDEREVNHSEGCLQRCVPVELPHNEICVSVP